MTPIAAGPGDQVCNREFGLFINGKRLASTAQRDSGGELLRKQEMARLFEFKAAGVTVATIRRMHEDGEVIRRLHIRTRAEITGARIAVAVDIL